MFAQWCGILVLLLYFLRGTVLPRYLHIPFGSLVGANVLLLVTAAAIAGAGGGRWRLTWVVVALSFGAGLTQAVQLNTSFSRWVGWVLLLVAVGPVVTNAAAVTIRRVAWHFAVRGLMLLAGVFVAWFWLRLPNFGAGHFSSFMNQCMLAGPFAGLGGAMASACALRRRSWKWAVLGLLSIFPLLASGSRVATLATAAAFGFLLFRRKPILATAGCILFASAAVIFMVNGESITQPNSLTGALASKGAVNTRAELWGSRIAEFKSSPLVGIGIGMGTGAGAAEEEGGSIRVEPGSSYLAVLAMTGAVGTGAFAWALGLLLTQYCRSKNGVDLEGDILSLTGVFLAVHGFAEGWILGFGSPLCFLFWLWLGRVGDIALHPAKAVTREKHLAQRVFPRTIRGRMAASGTFK